LGYLVEAYNERMGTNLKAADIKEWDISQYMGKEGFEIFKEEGFFENVPEKKNSVKALKKLISSDDYDVFIVTACTTNHELEEKFKWFDDNLPEFNKNRIIKCKEKEIIHGDVLIDDNINNLDKCSPFMRCILFDMPHNRDEDRYPRIKSINEAIPLLKEWFY
jgi:5'(3')-deoxyribonucleotidase